VAIAAVAQPATPFLLVVEPVHIVARIVVRIVVRIAAHTAVVGTRDDHYRPERRIVVGTRAAACTSVATAIRW